jgi:hypothetical protein
MTQAANLGALGTGASASGVLAVANGGTGATALGPAFSAIKTATQTRSSGVWTKVTFDTEEYDTNNNFASSTFTPTIAGYYLCTARTTLVADGTAMNEIATALYKNGSVFKNGNYIYQPASPIAQLGAEVSAVIYCNGSTDYVEFYGKSDGTTLSFQGVSGNSALTYFQGTLLRSA